MVVLIPTQAVFATQPDDKSLLRNTYSNSYRVLLVFRDLDYVD